MGLVYSRGKRKGKGYVQYDIHPWLFVLLESNVAFEKLMSCATQKNAE